MNNVRAMLLYLMGVCLYFSSCDRTREYSSEQISFDFSSISLMRVADSSFQSLAIICFDEDTCVSQISYYDASDFLDGHLQTDMMIGSYTTLFVANVKEDGLDVKKGMPLQDIRYYLPQKDKIWQEPLDVNTTIQKLNIKYNEPQAGVLVDMRRQIAWIQLAIWNIPNDVTQMMVELENVPSNIDYCGENRYEKIKMQKSIEIPSEGDSLKCDLYTYPFEKEDKVKLNLYYVRNAVTYYGSYALSNVLKRNQIMQLSMNYSEATCINIDPNAEDWSDSIVKEGIKIGASDDVIADNRPVKGEVSSVNLLKNGNFETEISNEWGFSETSGKDNIVVWQSDVVKDGEKAIRLEGKTYFYQDIPVEERKGYMLNLPVNVRSDSVRWKCYCSWRKTKSSALAALYNTSIQTLERKKTEGWENIFSDSLNKFRAPVGAKILRIEFRTYTEKKDTFGVNLDGLGVYEIKE